jgi:UDP-GlcNAc:undecaprenyl-phosphate GlcNAc-1-phosphate transferase
MGDTGSTFLGYILASISILGLFKVYAIVSFAAPFFILALPLFDTTVAIARRLLKGSSPMKPDRGHLHHKLIDAGLTQKQAVITLYCISGLLSLSVIVMILAGLLHGLLLIFAALFLAIVGYRIIFQENVDIFGDKND